jgi:tRNA-2-methylthio-N6-dimethylallyladenosine synthase
VKAPDRDPHKVCFLTFGCQMNKLDSELAAAEFLRHGVAVTPDDAEAATIVINTCSVRQHAEERALSNLGRFRKAKQQHPELVLALMGCMAQKDGEELLRRYPYLDIVCGTRRFLHLPELVEQARATGERFAVTDEEPMAFEREPGARPERYRAFVSILRGCNSFCTYCIVPYVRGRETSRDPAAIEAEVRALADDGCVDITLLGQNVDAYRHGETDLAALLERLDPTPGLLRLRFITSHPRDISERLLRAMADLPRVCEYLHMPAQSGSTRILQAMNRGYTAERYREIVAAARAIVPDIELAGDFIVGFPGETDADFEQTADLLRFARYNQAFIFKYSPREGTRAAERLTDDVPQEVKAQRNQTLLAIQQEVSSELQQSKRGRTLEVIVEGRSKRDADRLTGRTRGNDIVVFPKPSDLAIEPGTLAQVRITDSTPLTLFGEWVSG